MHKSLAITLSLLLLCLPQKTFAVPDNMAPVDLTNDVLYIGSEKIPAVSTTALTRFTAVDINAELLPEDESVYPIQFDSIIDVLVIHSPQLPELAAQQNTNHIEDLFSGLNIANEVLESSGVIGTFRIVDIIEQGFFDDKLTQANSNSPEVLTALKENNATQYLYQRSGADFILNIANTPRNFAGVASVANVLGTTEENLNRLVASYPLLGNNAIAQGSLSGRTMAHEFGHNLGLRHDRESFPDGASLNDNVISYGFTDPDRRFGSIMTATPCLSNGCIRRFYSSPDIVIDDIQMGVDESQRNAANGAKAVRATFQHSAYFNSRFQLANIVWQKTQDGFLLDWPDVIGADHYLLVPRSCTEFDSGFFVERLAGATRVNQGSALIQGLQQNSEVCIIAQRSSRDNQGVSRMLLGGTKLFMSDEYINLGASLIRLENEPEELTLDIQLSDPNVENSALILSLFYFAQENLVDNWFDEDDFESSQMITVLDSVMDYSFSGEGTTRQLTMNLKVPFTQISDAFSQVVELPQFVSPLRLRVGYLNESGVPIFSHFAINEGIPDTTIPKLLSVPRRLANQSSSELSFAIENLTLGSAISLIAEDGLVIEDETIEFIPSGGKERAHVKATVRTDSDLEEPLHLAIMLNGSMLEERVVFLPGPINQLPSLSLEASTALTAGTDVIISGNAIDTDGSIEEYRWSSLSGPALLGTALDQGDLLIPNAQAGDYRVELTVLDNSGSIARQNFSFTVRESIPTSAPDSPPREGGSGGGTLSLHFFVLLFWVFMLRLFHIKIPKRSGRHGFMRVS